MCPIVLRQPGGRAEEFLPHYEDAVGVGGWWSHQATGPVDVMGETGRTPALGLVTRAPLSFMLKLYPNTCCHCDALDCKHLSGPWGQKNAHAHWWLQAFCNQRASVLHPAGQHVISGCSSVRPESSELWNLISADIFPWIYPPSVSPSTLT